MKWDPKYSVGVKDIDDQHRKLINLIAQLQGVLDQGAVSRKNELFVVLKALIDYTHYHFEAEEQLMEEIRYSDRDGHKVLHQTLIDQIQDILKRAKQGESLNVFDLIGFLKSWLIDHIMKEDKKIGREWNQRRREALVSPLAQSAQDLRQRLETLKGLLDQELIGEDDHSAKKSSLLSDHYSALPVCDGEAVEQTRAELDRLLEAGLITDGERAASTAQIAAKLDLARVLEDELDVDGKLRKLKSLRDIEFITQAKFDQEKTSLLETL